MPTDVFVEISDPWELGEALNWPLLTGQLVECKSSEDAQIFVFKLDQEITYKNEKYYRFLVSNRHDGDAVTDIYSGRSVPCAYESISHQPDKAEKIMPDRRLYFIGSLSLTNQRLKKT